MHVATHTTLPHLHPTSVPDDPLPIVEGQKTCVIVAISSAIIKRTLVDGGVPLPRACTRVANPACHL